MYQTLNDNHGLYSVKQSYTTMIMTKIQNIISCRGSDMFLVISLKFDHFSVKHILAWEVVIDQVNCKSRQIPHNFLHFDEQFTLLKPLQNFNQLKTTKVSTFNYDSAELSANRIIKQKYISKCIQGSSNSFNPLIINCFIFFVRFQIILY